MVKLGCERTMGRYGYPWPKMLDCANFPADNDMCIRYCFYCHGCQMAIAKF